MHITQCIHRGVRAYPHSCATVCGDKSRTWLEWGIDIARLAGALQSIGLKHGDRVAMLARNGDCYADYIFAVPWAGGVLNPVNVRWAPQEIAYSLTDCDTRILIVDPEFAGLVPTICSLTPGLKRVFSTASSEWQRLIERAPTVDDERRAGDDLAAIMYTGGTTGVPKGVMLSHRNLMTSALGTVSCADGRTGERFLHAAPLFHVGALSGFLMASLCGSTSIFVPSFDVLSYLQTMERTRATELFLVPTMMRLLVDHPRFGEFDVSSVRRIRYGASPIDDTLMDRLLQIFPRVKFSQAYGMTELAPTATSLDPDDHVALARTDGRVRSAGRATPVTEVRIVDERDNEIARGEIGEIVCRGDNVMLGYWGKPDATEEVKRGGWMHTGDLGRMDDRGYVTVVDRIKDMIITGGENVYSSEVENAIATHAAVAAVAVIGVPDLKWGESVHAVVVLRPGRVVGPTELERHVKASLASYKVPRIFSFVEALPLSGAGKVLKQMLRQAFVSGKKVDQ